VVKDGNKLSQYRYIRLNVPIADEYNVLIQTTTPTPETPDTSDADQSDPDMFLYRAGEEVLRLLSENENIETGTTPFIEPGVYIADLRDYRFTSANIAASYPAEVCFDVRFDPTP
jgi:hypothetical protein